MAPREAVEVLIVASRFPWPPYRGDALRAAIWLEALRGVAHVTLVAPSGIMPTGMEHVAHVRVNRSAGALVRGIGGVAGRRMPMQSLLAARYDWAEALRGVSGTRFDATVVLLSRLEPFVRPLLRARFRVLDAVDSLARNAEERGAAGGVTRAFWSIEARRLRALERSAGRDYDAVVVVSDEERARFGERAISISNGVEIEALREGARAYDFGFWGRLAYFANRDAVATLLAEIWPAIRAERPDATLLVAGADAPASVTAWNGRDGVTVVSPMDDRAALLRSVRVALLPVRYGSGQSNKLLEAAEAGCAIVANPGILRGLDGFDDAVVVAEQAAEIASEALRLAGDRERAAAMGTRAREIVARSWTREAAHRALAELVVRGVGG